MIVYSGTKEILNNDIIHGNLALKVENAFESKLHEHVADNEFRAWENSLRRMNDVLQMTTLPNDVEVAVEFQIPLTSKRVDFMIAGCDSDDNKHVVIVELKQWEQARRTSRDSLVTTYINGGIKAVTHPSYQAFSYAKTIENFSASAQDANIHLYPCAYLHNYKWQFRDELANGLYKEIVDKSPFYIKDEEQELKSFIEHYIKKADQNKILYLIDNGRLRPSKALQDALKSMMDGNEEFIMIDEQKVVFETVKKLVEKAIKENKKYTVIVEGGPGTGKSVVAINLLVALRKYVVNYITKNSAPREVYFAKLKDAYKLGYVKNLFKGSGCYYDCPANTFDCLIVDEAHRLNAKSGMFQNKGENQIKEIINASKVSVFFIDEDQVVTSKDIGSINGIKHWAEALGSELYYNDETKLVSQFRCNGSDGYIAFWDNILGIRKTANYDLSDLNYDVKLFEDPNDMRLELLKKNHINNKARMIAGYCYEWVSKNNPNGYVYDINLPHDFHAKWNFGTTKTWAIDPDSFAQVGCIHTSQGLEFDYCGIIIGKDLRYENGHIITDASKRARSDKSLVGLYNNPLGVTADKIIRNTYKTLLTRGQKGCYIYCEDHALFEYLSQWLPVVHRNDEMDEI